MAITLAHLAKLEQDVLQKYILTNIVREAKIMEVIPWETMNSLSSAAVRYKELPSVAFRQVNDGYTASEGDVEQVWESLYGFGGDISFDRVFELVSNTIRDPKQLQMEMKLMALSMTFNDNFINGDHAVDPLSFEGLKKRVSNMPADQSVYFAGSAAAALDPTATVPEGRAFFDKLEELHYKAMLTGKGVLVVNRGMYYGLGRVARYIQATGGNFLSTTKDSFDREILVYKGTPIIDIGLKTDLSTEIIPDNELAGDSGTDATSIYAISFDPQKGLTGIQLNRPEVYDPLAGGEQEAKPAKLLRIDWWVGLASYGSYGIARGRNVEGASNWT